MMNKTQKILGLTLLILMVVVTAFALAEVAPSLMASIGWHDFASIGWVTAPS
jgi:hypothetical protein